MPAPPVHDRAPQDYGWYIIAVAVFAWVGWPRISAAARDYADRKALDEGRDRSKNADLIAARELAMRARLERVERDSRAGDLARKEKELQLAKQRAARAAGESGSGGGAPPAARRLEPRPLPDIGPSPMDPGFGGGPSFRPSTRRFQAAGR